MQIQSFQVVQDVNPLTLPIDYSGLGERGGPPVPIDIALDGSNGGQFRESVDNFLFSHISGVNDAIAALQCVKRFRAQKAVSV